MSLTGRNYAPETSRSKWTVRQIYTSREISQPKRLFFREFLHFSVDAVLPAL